MANIEQANAFIDYLFKSFSESKEITNIFDIIKYQDNHGLFLMYKCNQKEGYIITKIIYPTMEQLNNIKLIVIPTVDKLPMCSLTKCINLPDDDNRSVEMEKIKVYLLINSQFIDQEK